MATALALVDLLILSGAASGAITGGPGGPIPASGTGGQGASWPTALPGLAFESSIPEPIHVDYIESVTLTGLTHTWVGDLQIVLYDPTGKGYNLLCRPGMTSPSSLGASDDLNGTYVFKDSGQSFPLGGSGGVVTPGTYHPHFGLWVSGTHNIHNSPLTSGLFFSGTGIWTLRIYDWAAGDSGSLQSWSMDYIPVIPAPGCYLLLAITLAAPRRRRRGA